MASHLTVSSFASGAAPTTRSLSGQSGADQSGGLMGLFGALLSGIAGTETGAATAAANSSQSRLDFNLGDLVKFGLETGATGEDGGDSHGLDLALALAAPAQAQVTPQPVVDFIEALTALKINLDSGEPIDPGLLGDVEEKLGALSAALGLDLAALAIPDDFQALLEKVGNTHSGLTGTLSQLLGPLAQSFDQALAGDSDDASTHAKVTASTDAELLARLNSLGDRIGALLSSLGKGEVSADKLAALGLTPGQPAVAEIEQAIARFSAGILADAETVPHEPELATPTLKVTETVISGRSDGEPAKTTPGTNSAGVDTSRAVASTDQKSSDVDTSARDGKSDSDGGNSSEQKPSRSPDTPALHERAKDNGPRTQPVAAAPAAAPTEVSEAATAQNHGTRLDAVAAPRVIQAGYQTSQQQLNLPQIAFELARQAGDGNTRFQIRLDPPELGKIDVRLDIDTSGKVNARLTVEKSETLDLMQRDQRALEQALRQAGLDTGKTNLEFSLKQNPFSGQGAGQDQAGHKDGPDSSSTDGQAETAAEDALPLVNLYRGTLQASGVNIIA
ncbi:MAG: flagellar hook-length control protein FliK [Devosia sp.]|uniref:flagellar hook-length control protein FliK n=1 Tax=Devosia sp. TaxID=1871048 RepID=UPI0024CB0BDD|nr:flagellar hook-length control protein FliK [Devosia sp.]UYN98178.1 MAG: flagellar hook-length control protein FliK [Devosia sp.]